jgi:ActR/RegA family two-component response regulator
MTQITNDEERHVLILDDDRDFADSLAGVLRLEKYRVTVVYRYADVVAAIAKDPPHVALIDLRLDTKNGIEVVRLLHAEQPEILAVIITAYASIETTIAAMKAGAYDYLRKPVHSSEILAALDRCFERRRLAAERREALAQLARSEGRLRRLIEHSPSAISFEDENGTSLILNDRFRQLFPPGNENSALTAASDDAIIRAGGTVSREIILGSSQYARNLLVTRFPVFGEGERPIGIGTIATDVTETRQAEERLRQAQRLEALGRLTGGVAHDFNNLLAVVLGNLRLLEDELRNQPDLLEMVQEGIEATLNGSELTSRLLAIGQSQQLKPEVTDINEVLRGVVRMLDRVLGESIEIQLDLSPQLWNVRIDVRSLAIVAP